jgi:hypothetical protein
MAMRHVAQLEVYSRSVHESRLMLEVEVVCASEDLPLTSQERTINITLEDWIFALSAFILNCCSIVELQYVPIHRYPSAEATA